MLSQLLIAAVFFFVTLAGFAQTPPAPPRNIADILAVLDQFKPDPQAVEKLRIEAEASPPDSRHEQELAIFYHKRARANEAIGRSSQQIADLSKALHLALPSALPGPDGIGNTSRILIDLSIAEFWAGNWLQAVEVSKRLTNMMGISNQVASQLMLGDLTAARTAVRVADAKLNSLRGSRDWKYFGRGWQAMADRNHAMLLEVEGNFGEAERLLRRSLDLVATDYQEFSALGNAHWAIPIRSRSLWNWAMYEALLAKNLREQFRLSEATYHARNALTRSLQTFGRDSHYSAIILAEFGSLIFESGDFSNSSKVSHAAEEILTRSGARPESPSLARSRALLGESLVAQNDWQAAIDVFELSDRALATDPAQYARMNGSHPAWAIALLRTGETKKALIMLERLYRKRVASGLPDTEYFTAQLRGFYAMALAAEGEADKALTEFQGTIPILLDDARRFVGSEQGGAIARQMRLVWILEAYMKLLVEQRYSPLLKSVGIDAVAESFRIADIARGSAVQRALAESAARATPSDPALAALARREQEAQQRFVALSDLLNRLLSSPPEQQLPKIIGELRRDIDALRVERDALKAELDKRFPEYAELVAPKPTTLAQAQGALAADEALISIYVGAERSYVWAVPKADNAAFAEISLTATEAVRQVAHLRKALDVGEVAFEDMPRFDLAQAQSLYNQLLKPVEAGWREAKNLVVVPHKALGQLPFALLVTSPFVPPAPNATASLFADYRGAPWLIRRVAISQLPSVSTLLALRRMPPASAGRKEFAGFGDPLFSTAQAKLAAKDNPVTRRRLRNLSIGATISAPMETVANAPVKLPTVAVANSAGLAQLARLPDTAEEITSIAGVLKADAVNDVFLGKAASEKNVKSGQLDNRRVVMFATHGLVPGDLNGLTQPALALSAPEVTGNSGDDGLLTMDEVLGLRLNADWVILSACNTAAGNGAGSEAVSGLGKSFFFAGTRSLLVSNWPVETVSAKLLTTHLFEHQAANPATTRAEALRATMIDLMDKAVPPDTLGDKTYTYAHPMFWAPFVLVGDGGR